MEESNYKIYEAGDVLGLAEMLGKSEAELGLGKEYINDSLPSRSVEFTGQLFGAKANGSIIMRAETSGGECKVYALYIFSHELGYDDCKKKLIEKYGEFEYENEEPYVESLGGCVISCVFKSGGKRIKLETASERDYIYVCIDNIG